MAIKATIYKAMLQVADMDRNVYGDHSLTLPLQPSETEERLMVRLLAFALNVPADDLNGTLQLARGMADADEPDLWHKDLSLMPPTVLCTANLDILRDEGLAFAQVLRKAKVPLRHHEGVGLGHGFVNLIGIHGASRRMVRQMAASLRDVVLTHTFRAK